MKLSNHVYVELRTCSFALRHSQRTTPLRYLNEDPATAVAVSYSLAQHFLPGEVARWTDDQATTRAGSYFLAQQTPLLFARVASHLAKILHVWIHSAPRRVPRIQHLRTPCVGAMVELYVRNRGNSKQAHTSIQVR